MSVFMAHVKLHASSYSDKELRYFSKLFSGWKKSGHSVWAFFNNDIFGYAIKDAKRLIKMMG